MFVPIPHGIPSHDTFGRVFGLIDPKEFNKFLINWMNLVRERFSKDVISFDGKTLCGTAEKGIGLQGVHILNAWSKENGICIGQLKVSDKSNEIKAIPKLIKMLDLKGCIVTSDALNTQKEVVAIIKESGADYVLPVKDNHAGLLDDIKIFFEDAKKQDFRGIDADHFETLDKDHGRVEKRTYHIIDGEELPEKDLWKGVKSLGMVIRERTTEGKTTKEICYYINSIEIDAKLFEYSVRGHWGIENGLHWRLDVIFREDESRYRNRIGAQNLSAVRKITVGILMKDKTIKHGTASKRLAAAVDPEYRESLFKNFL
jgi:predicted transposase YbfD/YdcC